MTRLNFVNQVKVKLKLVKRKKRQLYLVSPRNLMGKNYNEVNDYKYNYINQKYSSILMSQKKRNVDLILKISNFTF